MTTPPPRDASGLAAELAAIFAAELEEQLRLAASLLPLAATPGAASPRRQLARIFHTVKGGAGLAGRADLAVAAESLERFFADSHAAGVPGRRALDLLFGAAGIAVPDGLPERVAPLRAVLLAVGEQRFALPLAALERAAVVEMRAVSARDGRLTVAVAGFVHRVVPLHDWMGEPQPARRAAALLLRAAGEGVVLLADRIGAPCQLRPAPIGGVLTDHPLASSVAIEPDGGACLVLDAQRLAALGVAPMPAAFPASSGDEAAPVSGAAAVLVVDDSRTVRNAIAEVLRAAGITFELAADGCEALAKLGGGRFAVVLTDLEMPNMDGFELIEALRGDGRWRSQPVVVCSSRPADESGRLHGLGIAGYLPKPFSPSLLLERVQPFVGTGAAADSGSA